MLNLLHLRHFLTISVMASVFALSACGFRPLHGESGTRQGDLAAIDVAIITDRSGQILRNALNTHLAPRGPAPVSLYRLNITLEESVQTLAIQKNAFAVRANLKLTARFTLSRLSDNAVLLSSRKSLVTGYNILNNDYATLIAQQNARERSLIEIADAIHAQLSVFTLQSKELAQPE